MTKLSQLSLSEKLLAIGYNVPTVVMSTWTKGARRVRTNKYAYRIKHVEAWCNYKLKLRKVKTGCPPMFPEFLKRFRIKEESNANLTPNS